MREWAVIADRLFSGQKVIMRQLVPGDLCNKEDEFCCGIHERQGGSRQAASSYRSQFSGLCGV